MNITNDRVTEYLEGLYQPLNLDLKQLRADAEEQHIPIILRESEAYLLNIIRTKKPRRILEIGTAIGYSAICFAAASPETEIVSLEVSEEMFQTASKNVERFGLSNRIQIKLGDAVESLKEMSSAIIDVDTAGFDLVFIDAAKSHYKEFWDGSIPLCRKSAVILSDNVLLKGTTASDEYVTEKRHKTSVKRMREFIEYIMKSDYADTAVLSVGDGVAFSVLRG
ncbi:MAG TPA: O-methyltransferase [Anaerovoracaceae bacterium]|nr:O-methyltransferase [Anaerovoracaceae bacterium]